MREDIAKLICERQRIGSREKSVKTALKLNPNLDYEDDYDWGPNYVSSSRHRQEGRCNPVAVNMGKKKSPCRSKNLNENLRPLYQFLDKSVGRPWNDVYSEICTNINPTKAIDYHVLQHVGWHVDINGTGSSSWRRGGLYVDDKGILCKEAPRPRYRWKDRYQPITSLHWYGNVWFKLEVLKTRAVCGCVHFKAPLLEEKLPRWRYRNSDFGPAVCIHGNEPVARPIWYVVEYFFHSPDDVFKEYRYEDSNEYTRFIYGLRKPGDVHTVYYRDVPEKLKEPIEKKTIRRTANRKHLKLIRIALEAAGQTAAQ
jgi:hypothetical protein